MPKRTKSETNTQNLLKKLTKDAENERKKNKVIRERLFRLKRHETPSGEFHFCLECNLPYHTLEFWNFYKCDHCKKVSWYCAKCDPMFSDIDCIECGVTLQRTSIR